MTTFSIIRYRIKPGRKDEFLAAHRTAAGEWPGLIRSDLVQIGPRGFCLIAEWDSEDALEQARPQMFAVYNRFSDTLEEFSAKLGHTIAMTGPVVLKLK